MESIKSISSDIVKENYFGLSYSSQIKIFDLYSDYLVLPSDLYFFKNVFHKYISIIKKFVEFKTNFSKYDDMQRKELRKIISKCKGKINPNNQINYDVEQSYICQSLDDDVIEKYINEFFSYSKKNEVALELATYYSDLIDYSFHDFLKLCESNKDMFNNEIRKISDDFYSLYLIMNTVDRMKYIWHLSNFNSEIDNDLSKGFSDDSKYLKPVSSVDDERTKKLSKYFKMDN